MIRQALFEHREHLLCAPARGADDENVAETGLVVAIAFGEAIADRVAGRPIWRLRVQVPPDETVKLDLGPQNSLSARDDFPKDES